MKIILFQSFRCWIVVALLGCWVMAAPAQSLPLTITNAAEAKAEGEALVQEILAQRPVENMSAKGRLIIRHSQGDKIEKAIQFETTLNAAGWATVYEAADGAKQERFVVRHVTGELPAYSLLNGQDEATNETMQTGADLMKPFAGSDFWMVDLGLDFLNWPGQRLIRKEICRTRSCRVLESTQPSPPSDGYAKVLTWVDRESLGIVQAEAYDATGKKLKVFSPKVVKESGGQWQLQEMEMRNVQTGSRSKIEFDLSESKDKP